MNNTKLTSVKILKGLYEQFKFSTVNTKMSLQKITNRALFLYTSDPDFKNAIETADNLIVSGSNF